MPIRFHWPNHKNLKIRSGYPQSWPFPELRILNTRRPIFEPLNCLKGLNKVNLSNGKVVLAPSLCGENCFRVIRDMSDCISFPDERNESLLVIFKKPIWPPSGNKNRYREYGIENLPHEAPGAPKIFRFERLNIFRIELNLLLFVTFYRNL